jgi:hypothetical protein
MMLLVEFSGIFCNRFLFEPVRSLGTELTLATLIDEFESSCLRFNDSLRAREALALENNRRLGSGNL